MLICLVCFQFIVQAPGYENSKTYTFFQSLPQFWKTFFKWMGFEKYEEPIWVSLLPYVIFFSLAAILYDNFKHKKEIDSRQVRVVEIDLN